jgi:NitT/TauT family transport system substrate-binding protein
MPVGLWPHLADKLGYFEDEGIKVDKYISVSTGSDAVTGMEAGSVQVSHIGPEGIPAASKGAKVVGIAAAADASPFTVIAGSDIESWADLKGETIALGSVQDVTRVIFDQLAKEAGIDPSKDLTYVSLGPTPARLAAVENGQAAATVATYPSAAQILADTDLVNLGFAPEGSDVPALAVTDIEASKEWAEANPDVVSAYLRAILRVFEYARDPKNTDQLVDMITDLDGLSPEAVREGLNQYIYNPIAKGAYFPENLHHGPGVFDQTVDAYRTLGTVTTDMAEDDYMDYSYLDKALETLDAE